jgi:hypothetical protein
MTAATTTRSRNVRKVLGSLAIVGAAAGVAGMGTFGTFTDSTAPLAASVTSGILDIVLTGPNTTTAPTTMSAANFVPGDSISRPVDLSNKGNVAMAGISLTSAVTGTAPANLLTTDGVNGLQLSLKSCPVAWTESTPGAWTCSSPTTLLNGPAVVTGPVANLASANVGGVDHLLATLSLPVSADNRFQGLTSNLAISFTASQATGTNR